jgi:hypothetical protein
MQRGIGVILLVTALAASARAEELPWKSDLAEALAEAKEKKRPVLVGLFIPYVETDVEKQDASLLADAVRERLAGVVLLRANLLAHPEWRRGSVWSMPDYLFLDADGTVVHAHREAMSAAAFDDFAKARAERDALAANASAQDAGAAEFAALARWHASHLNRALAAQSFRRAADATTDVAAALPLLLEMSNACSDRFAPWRDEASARWALARMKELDPKDEHAFAGKAALRGVEVTIEAGRHAEGAEEARAFLEAHPQDDIAGEMLQRRLWALYRLGEFSQMSKALTGRKALRISDNVELELRRTADRVVALVTLRFAADREPPKFEAVLRFLQAIHDDPPQGFWIRYLRRATSAPDAPADKAAALKLELAKALVETDDAGRAEAKTLLDELLAAPDAMDADARKRAEKLLARLGGGAVKKK